MRHTGPFDFVSVYAEANSKLREWGTNEELYDLLLAHRLASGKPILVLGDYKMPQETVQEFIDERGAPLIALGPGEDTYISGDNRACIDFAIAHRTLAGLVSGPTLVVGLDLKPHRAVIVGMRLPGPEETANV